MKIRGRRRLVWTAVAMLLLAVAVVVPVSIWSNKKDDKVKGASTSFETSDSSLSTGGDDPATGDATPAEPFGGTPVPTITPLESPPTLSPTVPVTSAETAPPTTGSSIADTAIPTTAFTNTETSVPSAPLTCSSATKLVCPAPDSNNVADTNSTAGTNSTDTNTTENSNVTTPDWALVANDIVGEAAGDLSGFGISTSCDGTIVAVGADENDGNGDKAGHVRVFHLVQNSTTTVWEQLGSDVDGEAAVDRFGYSVSLSASGLRMAVGARFNDGGEYSNTSNTDHVRVFDYNDDDWTQIGEEIEGEAEGDQAGRSVSISADGSRLAIGATGNDETAIDAGQVRVYELQEEGSTFKWTKLGQDIDGEAEKDRFGRSVSISADGTTVAVGAYSSDRSGEEDAGHVLVYRLDSTSQWVQMGQALNGTNTGDWAGLTVSLSSDGNRLAIGSPGDNSRFLPGSTAVYGFADGNWNQLGSETTLEGGFSVSLSHDGSRVAVGDYKGYSAGLNSGQVYVYEYDGDDEGGGDTWRVVGTEIAGVAGELSGTDVSLSSDGYRVAVSSPVHSNTEIGVQVGAVRVYDLCY